MKLKISVLLFVFGIANARRMPSFTPDKPYEEKKDVAEEMIGNADDIEEEYDDVMEGLYTEKTSNDDLGIPPDADYENKEMGNRDGMDEIHEDDLNNTGKSAHDSSKFVSEEVPGAGEKRFDPIPAFYHLGQIEAYIKQIQKAMEKAFRQTVEEALHQNGTYVNSTEDEEDVDGHKYHVHKSIIQAGDNESSIFIEAIESDAEPDRKKRSNWLSEEAHTAKSTDP